MTRVQKHAEMVYAEAYLIKALLFLLTDPNMVGFVREGLAIRQAYSTYKQCYKYLLSVMKEAGGPNSPRKAFEDAGVDEHFIQGIYQGMGAFNLILSTLPARLLRIFEMIGFSGERGFGLKALEIGAKWESDNSVLIPISRKSKRKQVVNFFGTAEQLCKGFGTRRFLCDLSLMLYHIVP